MSTWAGDLIRIARYEAGLSQRELARRATTSQSTLSAYESGKKSPTLETLERILRAAGLTPRILLEPYDDHDDWIARYEATLDPRDVERWRSVVRTATET
ncbi:MAG TPA: helix-turn-helix transcriptional regulator [Actinomycetota bacterium]|nr:helix-turn-helix transcriptional regulator [Actinomycetota bacterium]